MTNEQLAVLLDTYRERLSAAILLVQAVAPESSENAERPYWYFQGLWDVVYELEEERNALVDKEWRRL